MCNYGDMIEANTNARMKRDLTIKMLQDEEPMEKICRYTELSVEEIQQIAKENGILEKLHA